MNDQLQAKLVWDGGDEVRIPECMGTPRGDQMQGTALERLAELAGRTCYDSLGKGRPSFSAYIEGDGTEITSASGHVREVEGYHDHIRSVGHGSVLEHAAFTVEIPMLKSRQGNALRRVFSACCLNRPGVLVFHSHKGVRVTLNLRSVVEWLTWEQSLYGRVREAARAAEKVNPMARQFSFMLRRLGHKLAPHIVSIQEMTDEPYVVEEFLAARIVQPRVDDERWVSLWVEHPLISAFKESDQWHTRDGANHGMTPELDMTLRNISQVEPVAARAYIVAVKYLEPWLVSRGVDKQTARKQARGEARGYLGNALATEMIFSASVSQWKRILRQRASVFADAEIREIACKALAELKASRYGESFANFHVEPSPDGIGQVAVEEAKEVALV